MSRQEMNSYHTSVLLQETIEALNIQSGKQYIDATLGGGGHTRLILERGGKVLGIDQDEDAIGYVKRNFEFSISNSQLKLVKGNFKNIDIIAKEKGFKKVNGILFDLGISSHHVDMPERGFSFQKEGPLDMRMDRDLKIKAADLINILTKGELYDLFTKLGEERYASAIARSIVSARQIKRIETTVELAEIIRKAVPFSKNKKGINPATQVFQALRIAVNDELNGLTEALPKAVALLERGGRLVVISFHSLEDRIVKHTFLNLAERGIGKIVTKKPIIPAEEEISANSRARSSKLRVFEKL